MSDRAAGPSRGVHHARVEWADTDAAGIHHNSAILRYAEAAEAALMRDSGVDGYFPVAPRVRLEVDFERPLTFGQEITAVVELERLGTSSMTFRFEIWAETGAGRPRGRAAFGRYVTVHVAGSHADGTARSTPWPDGWRRALSPAAAAASD